MKILYLGPPCEEWHREPYAFGRHGPKPGSTDNIEGWQPFSQVRPPLSLPGGCTYQVQSSTAPIRALTCLNTDKPEKASVDRG